MSNYRRNHYVPEWYQRRFIPKDAKDNNLYYLDLKPKLFNSNGHVYTNESLIRRGRPGVLLKMIYILQI